MAYTGSKAKRGAGSLLKIDISATETPDYQTIPEVTAAPINPGTQDEIETTNMESTAKEYVKGFADRGSLPIQGNWDPTNTVLTTLATYGKTGEKRKFKYEFPQFSKYVTFDGIVGQVNINPDLKGVISYSCDVKITGDVSDPQALS